MIHSAVQSKLSRSAFEAIAALANREFGLKLTSEKTTMVQSRLRHRLRALNLPDFEAYANLVCSAPGMEERRSMISALTTNVSHFFREPHHFDVLTQALLPKMRDRIKAGGRIRIWSAGASNGQEPYSIAMHMLRAEPALAQADFRILATDVDPKVVAFAKAGIYPKPLTTGVSEEDKARFMQAGPDAFSIVDDVRRCVAFHELNLLAEWPMRHQFDAIFCRNVVIYFEQTTQDRLWPRFHAALRDDGLFFLGHSERITAPATTGFKTIGTTAYAKICESAQQSAHYPGEKNGTS